ncbi:MAG: acyl-CoA dehydrogenase C-terminal domain-containing protein [Steroidobacteraceae bacterium]
MPSYSDYSKEDADTILTEAAKFAEQVLDPISRPGDIEGARWTPEGVRMPPAFKDAYRRFVAGGWTQLRAPSEYGGQHVPYALGVAVEELWAASNLAFKLCPMLTQGAIEAILHMGSDEQKERYLRTMISGEWTGTMNLTEPQAGSDLGLIRTRAVPEGDHFRLFGQKIFITYGDHDYTPNIIHMVLARIDGAPPGTRGISLFIVPKRLVNADGSLGEPNEVRSVSIEHKLGIHASPTCVLAYGDKNGAVGYLVGEANRGLEYMFVMMNAARLSVGLEGYAVSERAYQRALEWARTRIQGKPAGGAGAGPRPIAYHPDVKRMLLTMRAYTEAARSLALHAAHQLDLAAEHPDAAAREMAQARGDLLIPVVKAWSTELGIEVASLGVQVHGGMGYIEETGAAQDYRDVRITTIYEGTTGIQANDFIGRKIGRDRGAALAAFIGEMSRELDSLPRAGVAGSVRSAALDAVQQLGDATGVLLEALSAAPERGLAVAVPFLRLAGMAFGGWLMAKAAAVASQRLAAGSTERDFYNAKLQTARFYAEHLLPGTLALAKTIKSGAMSVVEADPALL